MNVRYFALIVGILYVVGAIGGFIPGLRTPPADGANLSVEVMPGRALGLFPVNILHNFTHLAVGVWGSWLTAASLPPAPSLAA